MQINIKIAIYMYVFNIYTHGSVSAKFGKTGNAPAMCKFTRTISSYFRYPYNSKTITPTHLKFCISNKAYWNT